MPCSFKSRAALSVLVLTASSSFAFAQGTGYDALKANYFDPTTGWVKRVDTLHGEVDDHWFTDYEALDLGGAGQKDWDNFTVPHWKRFDPQAPQTDTIFPVEPSLPNWVTQNPPAGLYVVTGKYLAGAIQWPHEEFVEEYLAGTLSDLTSAHYRPVYWVVDYTLYIPENYGKDDTPYNTARRGMAAVLTAGGATHSGPLPPWIDPILSETQFRTQVAIETAQRLQIPVLYVDTPVGTLGSNTNFVQALGYTREGTVYFDDLWALVEEPSPLYKFHPQYLYMASYIRGITFLEGFFNPVANSTTSWSVWDDILDEEDPTHGGERYVAITNAAIEGGSKRGHAVYKAGLYDDRVKAVVSQGNGNLRILENWRIALDEQWEDRDSETDDADTDATHEDPDQLLLASKMQEAVDRHAGYLAGLAPRTFQYYDIHTILRDNADPGHWDTLRICNNQGAQDPFWPLQSWARWIDDAVSTKVPNQCYDFMPKALHAPNHTVFAQQVQAFLQHHYFGRPMPTVQILDVQYDLPDPGQSPGTIPLVVKAKVVLPLDETHWPRATRSGGSQTDPANMTIRLCLAIRPMEDDAGAPLGRGMWSNDKFGEPDFRQTPFWEIAPTSLIASTDQSGTFISFNVTFEAESSAYATVNDGDEAYFPPGFEDEYAAGLDLDGIPPNYHVAFYVRCAAYQDSADETWDDGDNSIPIRASSAIHFLPPWHGN